MTLRSAARDLLLLATPLPALIVGVLTMRHMGVRTSTWSMNLAACAASILLFAALRYSRWVDGRRVPLILGIGSVAVIAGTFASEGLDGVHRWLSIGGFRLHASAIVAPLIIVSVVSLSSRRLAAAIAAAASLLLALQPDAAQTCSVAAACGVVLARDLRLATLQRLGALAAIIASAVTSLIRIDPRQPVPHVEQIHQLAAARGPAWAAVAFIALLLLPLPYVAASLRQRHVLPLALGLYVAVITAAPLWGSFPVPVMGYGISPILGVFIALAFLARRVN